MQRKYLASQRPLANKSLHKVMRRRRNLFGWNWKNSK